MMAGSYNHAVDIQGRLLNSLNMGGAIETGGDAYETIEEFFGMVWWLAQGDPQRVEEARQNYLAGIDLSPGREPE